MPVFWPHSTELCATSPTTGRIFVRAPDSQNTFKMKYYSRALTERKGFEKSRESDPEFERTQGSMPMRARHVQQYEPGAFRVSGARLAIGD